MGRPLGRPHDEDGPRTTRRLRDPTRDTALFRSCLRSQRATTRRATRVCWSRPSGCFPRPRAGVEIGPGSARLDGFPAGKTTVPSVRPESEELPVTQCLEQQIAHPAIDAAQTRELLTRQAQTGHLQILGAHAFDEIANGSHGGIHHAVGPSLRVRWRYSNVPHDPGHT